MIKTGSLSYKGNNIYNDTATKQTILVKRKRGAKTVFYVKEQNDGNSTDSFRIKGPGKQAGFSVTYLAGAKGTTNITSQVVNGTYVLKNVAPGRSRIFRLVVRVKLGATLGTTKSWLVRAISAHDSTKKDAVKASVRVTS
jgi:hypothetical protein